MMRSGLFDHLVVAQPTILAQLEPDRLDRETQDISAALGDLGVAGGDLVLVGGEGCQDFGLLALGDLDEVQGATELRACRAKPGSTE